ncbi:NADP-dependent oxidoreductase [Photobacterium sp.]|uniref:NADP-dependent oxidoreductase n=1 Tax=Photobacterium sp. TaxID=660 RepID=UPI00299E24BA|nr:NADP-dependent oxidoreductase [Photobacterium sp.]MDX1301271.1 NADP-dependent oxidoreductase [Photobacterium sp.]
MTETQSTNSRIVLASRPVGAPTENNFRLETVAKPVPASGEVLLRAVYLSLDPYMRGRMSDAKSYAEPLAVEDVMLGSTVCQIEQSNNPEFEVGEWVLAYTGWQQYGLSDGEGLLKLGKEPTAPSYALGIMGMPGFTAYMGLLDIGQPKQGDTLVVAAATGPVGATVGQIGKLKGCRVIGIAGGEEKCRYAKEILGFDECIDHKAEDFELQLATACDNGIDIYFENVGGKVFDAVLPLLNTSARVPVCGLISQYNATSLPEGPDRTSMLMGIILAKRIKMQGFIIFEDYASHYNEFAQDMTQWISEGKIQYREHLVEGLVNAPEAFIGLLEGKNFGKLVIQINQPL